MAAQNLSLPYKTRTVFPGSRGVCLVSADGAFGTESLSGVQSNRTLNSHADKIILSLQ